MINAQEWLDSEYTNKEKIAETTELEINGKKLKEKLDLELEGEFDLKSFVNLKKIVITHNPKLKLSNVINNLPKSIEEIIVDSGKPPLKGDFNLSGYPNLISFWASWNGFTNLYWLSTLPNKVSLERLGFYGNKITDPDFKFLADNFLNLKAISLTSNPLNSDLSVRPLGKLTKLEDLWVNEISKIKDLEYLPTSLKRINNSEEKWSLWKENNKRLVERAQKETWKEKGFSEQEIEQLTRLIEDGWDFNRYWEKRVMGWLYNQEECSSLEKRREVEKLDIGNQDLVGELDLKEFTSLKDLNCSNNRIISLDLSKCLNLVKINCNNNEIADLRFLQSAVRLSKIDFSNCPLEGSLKPLESLSNLKELNIANTNLSEGLEYLPNCCKKFYCNSDNQYRSVKIADELDKFECSEKDEINVKYYNLDKWREIRKEEKQNEMIASIIPLERLYVIRGNIRQFLRKWGINKNTGNDGENTNWYNKLLTKKEINNISQLQSPEELYKLQLVIYGTQFIGRGSAVVGAVLLFQDSQTIGGGIAAVYPITELVVSKLEESLRNKENKWKEFLSDTDNFLDNYNELSGILDQFEVGKLKGGIIKKALRNLSKKVKKFSEVYDDDGNGEIDISELTARRDKFTEDLNREEKNNKIKGIVDAIKKLEEAIIKYRKSSYGIGDFEEQKLSKGKNVEELEEEIINEPETSENKNSAGARKRTSHFRNNDSKSSDLMSAQAKEELQTQIQISSKDSL